MPHATGIAVPYFSRPRGTGMDVGSARDLFREIQGDISPHRYVCTSGSLTLSTILVKWRCVHTVHTYLQECSFLVGADVREDFLLRVGCGLNCKLSICSARPVPDCNFSIG